MKDEDSGRVKRKSHWNKEEKRNMKTEEECKRENKRNRKER